MRIPWILLLLSTAAFAAEWPGFRGPSRQGLAEGALPGGTLAWKTEIPGDGWSSPVIWGGRVFLTTATESGASCRLLAVDRDSGAIRWNVEVLRQKTGRIEKRNGYATPTPVTDGKLVYTVCGDGTFAAFDFQGVRRWINSNYPHHSQHGLGSSPVLAGGLVIMARDGSSDGPNPKLGWQEPWDQSFVVALDAQTGRERWKSSRGLSRIAHATPVIVGSAVISSAGDVVQGFDLATGKLLWTARNPGEGVVPSIVSGDGLLFAASGFGSPMIRAVRPGGEVAWEQSKGVPMISSLLYSDSLVYSFTTSGIAWCFDAATGRPVWQSRLGGEFSASPALVDGRIVIPNDQGTLFVLKAGREFVLESQRDLGEPIQASAAIAAGKLILRTQRHLLCYH